LRDIQNILGSDEYPKLRFGIGNVFPKGMQVEFVLGKWKPNEVPLVKYKIEKSVELIESFAFVGIDKTMTVCNSTSYDLNKS
jgi:PTH1 family peptidyl-tRNA hydrolase